MSAPRSRNRKHELRSLFKYTTAATAKTILKTLRLRWSSPLEFNDPYDSTQDLRLSHSAVELNTALAHEIAEVIENLDPGVTSAQPEVASILEAAKRITSVEERRDLAREIRADPTQTTVGQVDALNGLERYWKEAVPTFRILCLSKSKDVTSMWYHYADKYKGIVLEFGCMDETDSALLLAREVKYQNGPPIVGDVRAWARCSLGLSGNLWEFFLECVYVKHTDWASEYEWRVFTYAKDGDKAHFTDTRFNPTELLAVYLGEQCSPADEHEIRALLVGPLAHAKVFRARRDPAKGRFVFDQAS